MKPFFKWFVRIVVYPLPIVGYLLTAYYIPLQNTLFLEMPKPTVILRDVSAYHYDFRGAEVKAGFSKGVITPTSWQWLAGYHPPHPGVFDNDTLWAKSLALQDKNGNTIVIVSCDLIGLLPDEIKKIKALVRNVGPDNVFISCTHTHSGPDTMGIWGIIPLVIDGKDEDYMSFLRKQIVAVINTSVSNLRQAKIRFGKGEFVGYANGRYENPADPGVSVMQILIPLDEMVTLVNYAVHADVMNSFYVTADFPYFLSERIKNLTGGETMFLPGAIGGVQPSGSEHIEFFDFAKIMGENLADRVVFKILKKPIIPKSVIISLRTLKLKAPLENNGFAFGAWTGALPELRGESGLVTAEVSRIKIGPAEILTVPGELFPKIWWKVKPLMKGEPKFVFGLTNGAFGYIMLPEDIESGRHKYHVSVSVGPTFGTEVEKALKELVTKNKE